MQDASERELAVIMHVDVVGSTALVRADEALAHARIQGAFRRLTTTVDTHGGKAQEVRGDALVAIFTRASDAVEAALSFQEANATFLSSLTDDIKPVARIGIALGEVVIADGTITGEAVVLAQRLEQLAGAGEVCIQRTVRETVPGRLPYAYEKRDNQTLKGFDEPVQVFIVERLPEIGLPNLQDPPTMSQSALSLPDKPSIAVLPFTNMSDDPEQEYFSDGMTEEIITALSQIPRLFVIARNSTFAYKGKPLKIQQIAEELAVRYVLEGSVQRSDDRVRITVQLIDATTGHHLWADNYDRQVKDIFALQDEIAMKIMAELQVELSEIGRAHV